MATTMVNGRQNAVIAKQGFDYTDFTSGSASAVKVKLPYGAIVIGGFVVISTTFNGTTPVLDVGDASSANRYKNDVAMGSAALTALTPTGYVSDGGDITLTATFTGSNTQGAGYVVVEYIIDGRATEVQPN